MAFLEDQILIHELLQKNLLNREKLAQIQNIAKETLESDGITGTILKFLKIDELKIAEIISEKFQIPIIRNVNGLSWVPVSGLSKDDIPARFRFVPVIFDENELTIAIIDPPYQKFIDYLKKVTNRHIVPIVLKFSDFDQLYKNSNAKAEMAKPIKIDFEKIDVAKRGEKWADESEASGILPPANRVLEKLIETALESNASDIHFELSRQKYFNVRFRLDGVLQRVVTLPKIYNKSLPTVIKQSSSMDAFDTKKIQEGHSMFSINGKSINTRVNSIPTSDGEKITIRILKKNLDIICLEQIGLSLHDFYRLKELITYPDSIVLFVGPAGSGKTTTMYSALNECKHISRNIATVESPIECLIDGVNQTSVVTNREYTFTQAIKALFHHDVDLLSLGEIRHKEEAELLIEAGLTGMMAFSTLQASDAIKSLYRLQNLGVHTEELALVLRGIVAQRFVRRICQSCKIDYKPDKETLERAGLLNLETDIKFKRGTGCKSCLGTGFLGRIPLFEILMIDEVISSMIHKGRSYSEIKKAAKRIGFTTMRYDGLRKALAGMTTLEEVVRVT